MPSVGAACKQGDVDGGMALPDSGGESYQHAREAFAPGTHEPYPDPGHNQLVLSEPTYVKYPTHFEGAVTTFELGLAVRATRHER